MGGGGDKLPIDTPENIRESIVLWYNIDKQGATNDSMAKCPYLIDLSGNNHHARCYNFAWEQMSGVGGYLDRDMDKWFTREPPQSETAMTSSAIFERNGNWLRITQPEYQRNGPYICENNSSISNNGYITYDKTARTITNKAFTIQVVGLPKDGSVNLYLWGTYYHNGKSKSGLKQVLSNGINSISSQTMTVDNEISDSDLFYYPVIHCYSTNFEPIQTDITIEILPQYPNGLIGDGVDDVCVSEKIPILTKKNGFTIVAKREFIETIGKYGAIASDRINLGKPTGGYMFEYFGNLAQLGETGIDAFYDDYEHIIPYSLQEDLISFMTSQQYNERKITKQTSNVESNPHICLFGSTAKQSPSPINAVIYSIALFNKDLEDNEIDWIKQNLM